MADKPVGRVLSALLVAGALVALGVGSGSAATAARDVDTSVYAITFWPARDAVLPTAHYNGYAGHEIRKGLRFIFGADLRSEIGTRPPTVIRIRAVLPSGLRWGDRPPEPGTSYVRVFPPWGWMWTPESQGCTVEGQVVECQTTGGGTTNGGWFGWLFDVVAERGGTYQLRVEIVEPPRSVDITPGNNAGWVDVILSQGAGSTGVSVSAVKLSRPSPSLVRASVTVKTSKGLLAVPRGVTCKASILGDRSYRGITDVKAAPGFVGCSVLFNNSRHRGKTLRGTLAFTVDGKRVTRSFRVRI